MQPVRAKSGLSCAASRYFGLRITRMNTNGSRTAVHLASDIGVLLHQLAGMMSGFVPVVLLVATTLSMCAAEESKLVEKRLEEIRDSGVSRLGKQALAIRPAEWKHGESQ